VSRAFALLQWVYDQYAVLWSNGFARTSEQRFFPINVMYCDFFVIS